jgi:hypothetical protein
MDDATAADQRTSLGLGAAALLEVSTGGNAAPDQDKLARYQNDGQLAATANMIVYDDDFPLDANKAAYYAHNSVSLPNGGGLYVTLQAPGNSAAITITLPPVSGTLIGTGNLTSITALGTVTTGTWQADDIALAYLAQGGATDGQAMVWDNTAGTWEPGTISSGLTIGTTSVASGTDGYILYNNAGTLGQLASTGSGNVVRAASPTLTTPVLGAARITSVEATGQPTTLLTAGGAAGDYGFHFSSFDGGSVSVGKSIAGGTVTGVIARADASYAWSSSDANPAIAADVWLFRGGAAATLEMGKDANADAVDQTLKACDGITGTDRSGGDLNLKSGLGTGAGAASAVIVSTPTALSTGTTAQSFTERLRIDSSGVTIGSGGSAIGTVKRTSATLVAGTVTVSDTDTTANSHIVVTVVTPGGTVGFLDFDVSAGSSYTINSSSILETSTVIITALHYP